MFPDNSCFVRRDLATAARSHGVFPQIGSLALEARRLINSHKVELLELLMGAELANKERTSSRVMPKSGKSLPWRHLFWQ